MSAFTPEQAQMLLNDHSGNESRFGMATAGLTFKLDRGLTLELVGHGWRREEETTFDLTNVDAPPALLRAVDDRAGTGITLKQADNSWNTQWAAGYEFSHQKIREGEDTRIVGGVAPYDGDVRRVHSVFLQARTSFFDDALHVLYGARHDHYSDADDPLSPRGGLIYQPTRDSAIKVLYGHAFRPTSAVEARGSTTSAPASGQPETFDMWELVLQKQAARGRASVTLFHSNWNDALVSVRNPTPPPLTLRRNIGENRAHGVEAGLTWIERDFRVDGSGSSTRSEDRTNDVDYVAFPRYIFNLGAGYTFNSLNLDVYLHNRIHLGVREGPVSGFVPAPADLKDHWGTDLTVTWRARDRDLDVFMALSNFTGHGNFFPSPAGAEGGIPDAGFTLSLGVRRSF
jgi:outer membrane receptor protein involved in Fe transport